MSWNCPSCAKKGDTTLLSDDGKNFQVAGKVSFIYSIDLKDLVVEKDKPHLERFRGRDNLAEAMKSVGDQKLTAFELDPVEARIPDEGYRFAAFRTRFVRGWLFNTFYPNDRAAPPKESELVDVWDDYYCDVRFSRLGSVDVKLTRYIPIAYRKKPSSRQSLIGAMKDLLSIRLSGASKDQEANLARYIAQKFVANVATIKVSEKDENEQVIRENSIRMKPFEDSWKENDNNIRVYERYTVLVLEHIECVTCHYRIEGRELWENNRSVVGAMLDGNLLEKHDDRDDETHSRFLLPPIDGYGTDHLKDLGSWQNDLCFFTHERALLYYPEIRIQINTLKSNRPGDTSIEYERYWRCIIRIIEHAVSMRTALYILELRTTRALSRVSDLTRNIIADDIVTEQEKGDIRGMAEKIAESFSVLPFLRDALVSTSNFRASYAANKFDYLTKDVFHLDETLDHIQRNIDETFEFLQYFKSVQLQYEAEQQARLERVEAERQADLERVQAERQARIEGLIARIGAVVAVLAIIAVAPSFVLDFMNLFRDQYCKLDEFSSFPGVQFLCSHPAPFAIFAVSCYLVVVVLPLLIAFYRYRTIIRTNVLNHPNPVEKG